MEIQKIFSDEYDMERLYSVLMNEEELKLFAGMDGGIVQKAVNGTLDKTINPIYLGIKRGMKKVNPSKLKEGFQNTTNSVLNKTINPLYKKLQGGSWSKVR